MTAPSVFFPACLDFVLAHEGGYVRDVGDPGGATNFGVSLRFLQDLSLKEADIDHDGVISWRDVARMTREDAAKIYRSYFWDKLGLEDMPGILAAAMFDTAVNCGRSRTVKWLQTGYNACLQVISRTLPLQVDGILGTATLRSVCSGCVMISGLDVRLASRILEQRQTHYLSQRDDPELGRYVKGWLNRLSDLRTFLLTLNKEKSK